MLAPSLLALATPLAQAASAVSGATLRGVEGAFHQLLRAGKETLSTDEVPKATDESHPEELQARADELLSDFEEAALALLNDAGIALTGPVTIESDRLGGIRVVGSDPQADWIERVLQGDASLARRFHELQSVKQEIHGQRQAEEIERLYALDPHAARQRFQETSSLDDEGFQVVLTPTRLPLSLPPRDR
jgi:hypothetical protein